MRVAVPKEIKAGEKRVALVPDIINKLTRLGLDVVIEAGAGAHSQATDADFITAGATVKQGDVLADEGLEDLLQRLRGEHLVSLQDERPELIGDRRLRNRGGLRYGFTGRLRGPG